MRRPRSARHTVGAAGWAAIGPGKDLRPDRVAGELARFPIRRGGHVLGHPRVPVDVHVQRRSVGQRQFLHRDRGRRPAKLRLGLRPGHLSGADVGAPGRRPRWSHARIPHLPTHRSQVSDSGSMMSRSLPAAPVPSTSTNTGRVPIEATIERDSRRRRLRRRDPGLSARPTPRPRAPCPLPTVARADVQPDTAPLVASHLVVTGSTGLEGRRPAGRRDHLLELSGERRWSAGP